MANKGRHNCFDPKSIVKTPGESPEWMSSDETQSKKIPATDRHREVEEEDGGKREREKREREGKRE